MVLDPSEGVAVVEELGRDPPPTVEVLPGTVVVDESVGVVTLVDVEVVTVVTVVATVVLDEVVGIEVGEEDVVVSGSVVVVLASVVVVVGRVVLVEVVLPLVWVKQNVT